MIKVYLQSVGNLIPYFAISNVISFSTYEHIVISNIFTLKKQVFHLFLLIKNKYLSSVIMIF